MKPHRRFAPHHKCLAPHQESLASQNKCFLSHHGKHLVAKPLIRIAGRPAEVRLGMWRTSASPQRAGRAGAWRLFALLVSAIFLGGLIAGCTQSQMKQAAIIMRDFSVALEKVQEAMIVAHKDGFLDDADHKRTQALIDQIALAGEEAVNTLQSANGKGAALDRSGGRRGRQYAAERKWEGRGAGETRYSADGDRPPFAGRCAAH